MKIRGVGQQKGHLGVFVLGDVGSKYHPKEVNLNPPREA